MVGSTELELKPFYHVPTPAQQAVPDSSTFTTLSNNVQIHQNKEEIAR